MNEGLNQNNNENWPLSEKEKKLKKLKDRLSLILSQGFSISRSPISEGYYSADPKTGEFTSNSQSVIRERVEYNKEKTSEIRATIKTLEALLKEIEDVANEK